MRTNGHVLTTELCRGASNGPAQAKGRSTLKTAGGSEPRSAPERPENAPVFDLEATVVPGPTNEQSKARTP